MDLEGRGKAGWDWLKIVIDGGTNISAAEILSLSVFLP
jgi:hypothetical protein